MAEFLFIQPSEMAETTILGGNVDIDKYVFNIANVQISVIEPLLGTELYNVISDGAENNTLTGDYLELYTKFVKPITKHQALAEYVEVSSFMITNGGAFKHAPENTETMDKDEIMLVSQKYSAFADMYVGRFNKWICKHTIPEYKRYQDEVNAMNIQNKGGWYFGSEKPTLYESDEL